MVEAKWEAWAWKLCNKLKLWQWSYLGIVVTLSLKDDWTCFCDFISGTREAINSRHRLKKNEEYCKWFLLDNVFWTYLCTNAHSVLMLRFVFLSAYNLRTVMTENSISIANLVLSWNSYFPLTEIFSDACKKKVTSFKRDIFQFWCRYYLAEWVIIFKNGIKNIFWGETVS